MLEAEGWITEHTHTHTTIQTHTHVLVCVEADESVLCGRFAGEILATLPAAVLTHSDEKTLNTGNPPLTEACE